MGDEEMRYGIQSKVYPLGHNRDYRGDKEMFTLSPINHYGQRSRMK